MSEHEFIGLDPKSRNADKAAVDAADALNDLARAKLTGADQYKGMTEAQAKSYIKEQQYHEERETTAEELVEKQKRDTRDRHILEERAEAIANNQQFDVLDVVGTLNANSQFNQQTGILENNEAKVDLAQHDFTRGAAALDIVGEEVSSDDFQRSQFVDLTFDASNIPQTDEPVAYQMALDVGEIKEYGYALFLDDEQEKLFDKIEANGGQVNREDSGMILAFDDKAYGDPDLVNPDSLNGRENVTDADIKGMMTLIRNSDDTYTLQVGTTNSNLEGTGGTMINNAKGATYNGKSLDDMSEAEIATFVEKTNVVLIDEDNAQEFTARIAMHSASNTLIMASEMSTSLEMGGNEVPSFASVAPMEFANVPQAEMNAQSAASEITNPFATIAPVSSEPVAQTVTMNENIIEDQASSGGATSDNAETEKGLPGQKTEAAVEPIIETATVNADPEFVATTDETDLAEGGTPITEIVPEATQNKFLDTQYEKVLDDKGEVVGETLTSTPAKNEAEPAQGLDAARAPDVIFQTDRKGIMDEYIAYQSDNSIVGEKLLTYQINSMILEGGLEGVKNAIVDAHGKKVGKHDLEADLAQIKSNGVVAEDPILREKISDLMKHDVSMPDKVLDNIRSIASRVSSEEQLSANAQKPVQLSNESVEVASTPPVVPTPTVSASVPPPPPPMPQSGGVPDSPAQASAPAASRPTPPVGVNDNTALEAAALGVAFGASAKVANVDREELFTFTPSIAVADGMQQERATQAGALG